MSIEPIEDVEAYVSGVINSTQLSIFENDSKVNANGNGIYLESTKIELPYILSIKGANPDVLSEYLNEVVSKANREVVLNTANLEKQKITNRLEQITLEKNMLLAKAKKDRLSQILRIKEEDAQKIRELNDLIERALYKAQKERLNDIQTLTDAAKLAGSLGIIENNLGQISDSNNDINLNIAINENEDLPEWYLFGEKALLERVELLKSRTSDDPFIPELVSLNNQINEIQNNNLLQTLEERQDDSPFIARVNELDIERINLESIIPESSGIDAMQLTQPASARQIPNSRRTIVVISFVAGFVLSIFLVLMMYLFKEDDTEPTTKTSR